MKQIVRNVKIIGTGSFVPERIITNEYLETIVPTNSHWIYDNLGIKERRIASNSESTSDLGVKAGINAVKDSGIGIEDIDLIIVATATPDRLAPSTASIIQNKMNAFNAVAFDLAAVCSGFLFAMSVATQYIAAGVYDNILVIGADTFSKITNWENRDCVFFGDGAGAVVISHTSNNDGFLATRLYTDGKGWSNFTIPAGGSEIPASFSTVENKLHFFKMNGSEVFKTGINVLTKAISEVLSDIKLSIDDISMMVPHQPSIKMLKETARLIGLPFTKVMTNMEKYANTSGGTIPILLDELNKANKIEKGDLILFAAVGAGWTYGASILKWA